MKSKELRVGNYVYDEQNDPCKISKLTSKKNDEYEGYFDGDDFQVEYDDKDNIYLSSVINPIPLTEQWLKEFGFWKSTEMTWYSSEPTEYNIPKLKLTNFKPKEDIPMLLDDKYGTHLKHVHQLQNLYFALTGKELE